MSIFLLTFGFFIVMFLAMAIGYIIQQKTLAGSCGGLGSVGIEKACNCDNPCEKRQERERQSALKENSLEVKNI
ncbi:Na(+)-translocating NADH-quinone reductase subunit E [Thalassotalea sp. 42_200_T64]|nr:Na(+)-translocating NADH-quinone reductase subunit E [Thalassotalea sp. 42_200_T64]